MAFVRQVILSVVVVAAALAVWIAYVPSALPWLERAGVLDILGVEPANGTPDAPGGGFARGGGGPAQVVASPVEMRAIDNRIEAIGDGQAIRSIAVRAESGGTVEDIAVRAGSRVEQGAVIARLSDDQERLALDRAELMEQDAQADMDRISQLAARGAASDVQTQAARLKLRTANLSVADARLALDRRTIRASFDGWIGLIAVEPGDRIAAQEQIAVLADRSSILIEFRVPERAVAQLRPGLPFQARPLALPGMTLSGKIVAIDNVVDRASRTLRVQGELANDDDVLRTGMAFSVALSIPGETLPAVDPLAVQWSSEGSFVWRVGAEGRAVRVPVVIRQRNADSVLVEADLEAGAMVITEGVQTLRPGAEVVLAGEKRAEAAKGGGGQGGRPGAQGQ